MTGILEVIKELKPNVGDQLKFIEIFTNHIKQKCESRGLFFFFLREKEERLVHTNDSLLPLSSKTCIKIFDFYL